MTDYASYERECFRGRDLLRYLFKNEYIVLSNKSNYFRQVRRLEKLKIVIVTEHKDPHYADLYNIKITTDVYKCKDKFV